MILFQKNLPPEINNNNYNYSKKKKKKTRQLLLAKQAFCFSSEEGITILRKQNSVLQICISRHESNWAVQDDFEEEDGETERSGCEHWSSFQVVNITLCLLLWKYWPETVLCDTMVLHKYSRVCSHHSSSSHNAFI